jgi:hypothetical protein
MPLTAFFCQDRLSHKDTSTNLPTSSVSAEASPYTNALDDRPRLVWQAPDPGYWSIGASFIDIDEGGGEVSVALPPVAGDAYLVASTLTTWMNIPAATTRTYTVTYNPATVKFTISASGPFSILWSSGTHGGSSGDNWRQWLGWELNPADTSSAASHTAPEKRHGTELWITFDLGSAKTVDAAACILDAGTAASINDANYSSAKFYGNAAPLSTTLRSHWEASAAKKLTFTDQPAESENRLQVAYDTAGAAMSYQYWAFSWRFFDEEPFHAVGIIKALKKYSSTTRQITELAGHGLKDPTSPLGVQTYYPAQSLTRWVAPLNFNAWDAADYRDTVQRVVREGAATGLVWALRWDEIVDGTYDAEDEADLGFLLWGAVTSYGQGTYSGRGSSDYISGELTVEQVR